MPTIEEAAKKTADRIMGTRGEALEWLRTTNGYLCTVRDEPDLREVTGGRNPSRTEYRRFEEEVNRILFFAN